jgi:hypothetical protein
VAATIKGSVNSGDITSNRTTSGNGMYIGGLVGQMPKNIKVTLTDCNVSGLMTNNTATNPNKSALGGLVGLCYANEVSGCHSTMSIVNTCGVKICAIIIKGNSFAIYNIYLIHNLNFIVV